MLTPDFRFVTAWSYRLPFGKGRTYAMSGVADTVLGGWVLSGIAEFMTGVPRPIKATDNSGTGLGLQHSDRIAGCNVNDAARDRFQWFNISCFVQPVFGHWGNAGQGILNDPRINNWNLTVGKVFQIREHHRVEFKLETFDTFNHTQWLAAVTSLASSSFGRITSARPARQIQGSLVYRF